MNTPTPTDVTTKNILTVCGVILIIIGLIISAGIVGYRLNYHQSFSAGDYVVLALGIVGLLGGVVMLILAFTVKFGDSDRPSPPTIRSR